MCSLPCGGTGTPAEELIAPLPAVEQQLLLEGMTFARLGQPVPEGGVTFATPIGRVTGKPQVYQPLLSLLDAGPLRVGQASQSPVAAPLIGSAIGGDILKSLLVGELLAGKTADVGALATELVAALGHSRRSLQRDGKPVTDQAEALRAVTEAVVATPVQEVPVLRRFGCVGRVIHREDAIHRRQNPAMTPDEHHDLPTPRRGSPLRLQSHRAD